MRKWLKAAFAAETVLTAIVCGLISYHFIYGFLAGGRPLLAYIYNMFFIIFMIAMDKAVNTLMYKENFLKGDHGRIRNFFAQVLFFAHFVSFKTALYLFYIVMLIISRVAVLEPDIISTYLRYFIYSVEYGILLLIPLDKFLDQITKDDKRLLKVLSRLKKARNANHI